MPGSINQPIARLGEWAYGYHSGTVHSVFDHAVNIRFVLDNSIRKLVTCTENDERLPDGISIGAIGFQQLKCGCEQIQLRPDQLILDTLRIPFIRKPCPIIPHTSLTMLRKIAETAENCVNLEPRIPDPAAVRGHLLKAATFLIKNQLPEAGDEAVRIIGWGSGLTPSSDDAIVGMLAILFSRQKKALFLDKSKLSATTDISAKYLDCAQRGFFTGRIADIFDTTKDLEQAICRAANWGASSGKDMLWGMIQTINGLNNLL